MGRLAELFEKKASGTMTEAEQKEFDTLQAEAKLLSEQKDVVADDTADAEDKAVDDLAQTLADKATERMEKNLQKVLDGITSKADNAVVTTKDSSSYIVDPKYGKKTIQELSEIKVVIPGRETKQVKEVSAKTAAFVGALFVNDVEKLQLLSEGTAADGGYLVPEEFANMIVEDVRDLNIMRQLAAAPISITSDTLHLPNLGTRPQAQWRAEKAVKATSTVTFGENVFTPYSLASIVGLTNELVADAQLGVGGSIVNYVSRVMATALAEKEEQAFWRGSGSGQPTGIDGGGYTLRAVVASASTDAARADALIAGYHRTPQGYRNKGVWVANSGTLEEIARLKDTNGRYLLTDLAAGPTPTIKGRPVYESNFLGGGVAIFGDLSYYQIVDREGISVRVSDEATVAGSSAFEKNLTYIRVEKRVDAELTLTSALTKVSGLGTI